MESAYTCYCLIVTGERKTEEGLNGTEEISGGKFASSLLPRPCSPVQLAKAEQGFTSKPEPVQPGLGHMPRWTDAAMDSCRVANFVTCERSFQLTMYKYERAWYA